MQTDRKSRRDKLIFRAQNPGGQLELSKIESSELREKIMLVNRAREFAGLTTEQAERELIIIIHLLGLAPAGYLAAPDNGPEGRLWGGASQGDGCRAVPLNLLNRV
jgi:hypothetical protein